MSRRVEGLLQWGAFAFIADGHEVHNDARCRIDDKKTSVDPRRLSCLRWMMSGQLTSAWYVCRQGSRHNSSPSAYSPKHTMHEPAVDHCSELPLAVPVVRANTQIERTGKQRMTSSLPCLTGRYRQDFSSRGGRIPEFFPGLSAQQLTRCNVHTQHLLALFWNISCTPNSLMQCPLLFRHHLLLRLERMFGTNPSLNRSQLPSTT